MSDQEDDDTSSVDTLELRNRFEILVEEIEELCASEELSLDALLQYFPLPPGSSVPNSPILHEACMNENVSLEIVECILKNIPEAAHMTWIFGEHDYATEAYPLHLACHNESCPVAVIELLLKRNPSALRHLSVVEYGLPSGVYNVSCVGGVPLHYYLARESNINLATVKILVNANPGAVMASDDESGFTPIHTLVHNPNISDMCDILQFFFDTEPSSIRRASSYNEVPLHRACTNRGADRKVIELLCGFWPDSIYQRTAGGGLPIHLLCHEVDSDTPTTLENLRLLLRMDPLSVMATNEEGELPIHLAAGHRSLEFCKTLLAAYPESVRVVTVEEKLPIHFACANGSVETLRHLFGLYPESINVRDSDGHLPIHEAAIWNGTQKAEKIRFLLANDPKGASKATTDSMFDRFSFPLHFTCGINFFVHTDIPTSVEENIKSAQLLFDSHPEAILAINGDGRSPLDVARREITELGRNNEPVVNFLEDQLVYARQAQDLTALTTPDSNGRLLLHDALRNNASLGATKLLVRGNTAALRVPDQDGILPLHFACEFGAANIVQFLVETDESTWDQCDVNKNYPLHFACRGANFGVVKYLLAKDAPGVSERNDDNKLPIQLLCESADENNVCQSPEYVEAIWRLLLAYPETVLYFE